MVAIEQIKQLVKNHQVPKILALGGVEQAMIDEALAMLRVYVLADGDQSLNHHRYAVGENLPHSWLSSVRTAPFLAPRRLVEVHNAEKLALGDVEEIISYLKNPVDFCVLILVFSKFDKRSKLVSALEQQRALFEFSPPTHAEVIALVTSEFKKYNIKANSESVEFIIILLDGDLIAIREIIKKLSLVHENSAISLEQIAAQAAGNALPDVFNLARSMSEGDIKSSLYTLGLLRQNQENAIKFLGVLMWQFRVLLHIRHCVDKGMAEWDIRKEVSVYGERFSWMLKVAKKRTIYFHINRLTKLIQCDLALKSQKISEPLTLIEKVLYQSAAGI
jgi:DNA polymerase-3 subunit delta